MDVQLLITTISEPGLGKSTDLVRTFPRGALVCQPGALAMAESLLGVTPPYVYEVRNLKEARVALKGIRANPPEGVYGVGLDDISILCKNTSRDVIKAFPKEGSGVYDYFNAMTDEVVRTHDAMMDTMEALNCPGMVTGHPRTPDEKCRGGLLFEGCSWKPTPAWGKACHIQVLAQTDEKRPTDYKSYYFCEPGNKLWTLKDRTAVCTKRTPMSMGEVLRAYGLDIPRPFDMEWMEEWVETLAGWIEESDGNIKDPGILAALADQLQGVDPLHVKWIKWDAYARFEIRRNLAASRATW